MQKEYDFSNAETGKFFNKNAKLHLPVYLEPEIESYFTKIAKEKHKSLSEIINTVLSKDLEIAKLLK